jgi:hypothetical protein
LELLLKRRELDEQGGSTSSREGERPRWSTGVGELRRQTAMGTVASFGGELTARGGIGWSGSAVGEGEEQGHPPVFIEGEGRGEGAREGEGRLAASSLCH